MPSVQASGVSADDAGNLSSPTVTAPWKTWVYLLVIVSFWTLIYAPGLAHPPMMDDADSEHAQIAREMLQRHDYVTAHVNGIRYLDKAPLPYWITCVTYSTFGVSEFSARLPLSLFALGCLIAVFFLGKDMAGPNAGFFAALVLGTAIGPYIYTRFEIPDIMICFWLIFTVHCFWKTLHEEKPSIYWCWGIGVITALDVLTKGLIGFVFPVGILGAYLLVTRDLKKIWALRPFSTFLVCFAVAAPWHILATLRNPPAGESKGFFWFYFINEQIYRYLNMRVPRDYDKVPLLIFWGLLLVWIFPWTLYLLSSLKQVPWRALREPANMNSRQKALVLMAAWALFVIGFFTFSTRQEYYVLPSLPALALLCGVWLADEEKSALGSPQRKTGRFYAGIMAVMGFVIFTISMTVVWLSRGQPNADLAGLLKKSPTMYKLSMGHMFDLTLGAMAVFHLPLILFGSAFLVGPFLVWIFRRRGNCFWSNVALSATMVIVFEAIHISLGIFNPVLGSKILADAIVKRYHQNDVIVVDGAYPAASSVNFYTGQNLHMLNGRYYDLWYGSLFPDSPPLFEDDASFERLWHGDHNVFFVVEKGIDAKRLETLATPNYVIAQWGDKAVFCNHPD